MLQNYNIKIKGEDSMIVSIGIIAYNEEKYINRILNDILAQTYPTKKIDLLLINSESTDSTLHLMNEFMKKNKHLFYNVQILENSKKIQAAGWNIAIKNFVGEALIRIDAHASVPPNFVYANVNCLYSGELVCGGIRPSIIDDNTPWKNVLLMAETSAFGSGIAPFRKKCSNTYVKSVFHGCYAREVIENDNVMHFDESLGRTEDNEFHYRIREAGYKICLCPNIISYQHTRNSLQSMVIQKFKNGYWIGRTLFVSPKCLSLYHFAPFLFIVLIISSAVMMLVTKSFFILIWAAYFILIFLITLMLILKNSEFYKQYLALPFLFFLIHSFYGVGTLFGIVSHLSRKVYQVFR